MSKVQHTPGPWSVWKNGQTIDAARYEDGSRHIVAIAQGDSPEEQRGNAILISTAPELLEALEEGAACLRAQIDGSGGYAVEEVLDGMLEALAKARGIYQRS